MKITLEHSYNAGYDAGKLAKKNLDFPTNPYPVGTEENDMWENGFQVGQGR